MITLVDSTKTTGLIFFPGTMVGMLLAGANPTDAVRLQLILLYALLGSVAIAGLVATGSPTATSSPRRSNCASRAPDAAHLGVLGRSRAEHRPSSLPRLVRPPARQHQPSTRGKRGRGVRGEVRGDVADRP